MKHLQHRGKQLRLTGEQMPQGDRKRDDPLADGDVRDDLFNQMGGGFRHTSGTTGGAKPSAFAGERHQLFMGAGATPQAQKPVG